MEGSEGKRNVQKGELNVPRGSVLSHCTLQKPDT